MAAVDLPPARVAGTPEGAPPAQGVNVTFKQAQKAKGKKGKKGGQDPLAFV